LEAIKLQAEKGWHHGFVHELEVTHAEAITRHVPSAEMVRYTSSGSEANFFAVRLARTFTKTTKIAKFEGGWHGPCDPLHIAMNSPSTNFHREVLRKARNSQRSSSRSMTLMVSKTV
jgi:glutamate-1-semialdehyde 2,1-aminomutase